MAPAHDASPSYCIPVASAAASASSHSHRLGASSAASSALASSRPRTRRAGAHAGSARGAVHAYSHDAATWLTARVGRTGLRRWMLVTLVSFGAAFLWSSSGSSPDAGAPQANSWWSALAGARARGGPDPDAVPVVDRTALEKLRLLEIHFGADEDDPALDAHDDLEPAARYPAQRKRPHDLDRPPLVVDIPEWVKPNPSAPPPPDKVPADALDAEVCGAQEGQRCQFLIPAWLGACFRSPFFASCTSLTLLYSRRARDKGAAAPVPARAARSCPEPHSRPAQRFSFSPRYLLQEPVRILLL